MEREEEKEEETSHVKKKTRKTRKENVKCKQKRNKTIHYTRNIQRILVP